MFKNMSLVIHKHMAKNDIGKLFEKLIVDLDLMNEFFIYKLKLLS